MSDRAVRTEITPVVSGVLATYDSDTLWRSRIFPTQGDAAAAIESWRKEDNGEGK